MRTLVNEYKLAGVYEVRIDASILSSGVYYYVLFVNGKRIVFKNMIILK
jgi:hypothetical protein